MNCWRQNFSRNIFSCGALKHEYDPHDLSRYMILKHSTDIYPMKAHPSGPLPGPGRTYLAGCQAIPPSLLNIFKELQEDLGCYIPNNGCLIPWAKQGVLLLNTSLTVRAGAAGSHRGKGWEIFTDSIIQRLNARTEPIVFLLWGNPAKAKQRLITNRHHLVLTAAHPSPLSAHRGFFGCRHFSKTNDFLKNTGQGEIDWQIPNL